MQGMRGGYGCRCRAAGKLYLCNDCKTSSLSIPCFAERRYGGVLEDELLIALPPKFLPKLIEGLARLSASGLRYPFPQYGIQSDAKAGLAASYGNRK